AVRWAGGADTDARRWSDTAEALAAQVQLLPGDRLVVHGGAPGLRLALLGLALRHGVELVLADDTTAPQALEALHADNTALVFADANGWATLLRANAGRALSLIAALDVREASPELMQALADAQASALNLALDPATGQPLAMGW